jgi:Na+-transporting NADH:ubiquinone oxidoreductase subunit NqrB
VSGPSRQAPLEAAARAPGRRLPAWLPGWFPAWFPELLPRDARVFQILFLASLLSAGVLLRDFSIRWEQMALTFAVGLATQHLALRVLARRVPGLRVGYLSAVVTCFGLSILLRADSLWVHPLAASLAMAAKFVVRVRGKHVFNPANLGVMLALLCLPGAWISPGQWGNDLVAMGWFVALGMVVSSRARRFDISIAFLLAWAALLGARVLWLGQPAAIFLHQVSGGALLLFAFFMISDPMTTPDRRGARIAFALLVAAGAFIWQFVLFRPNALVWSLFLATPLVPLLDRFAPGARFAWREEKRPPPMVDRSGAGGGLGYNPASMENRY